MIIMRINSFFYRSMIVIERVVKEKTTHCGKKKKILAAKTRVQYNEERF